MAAVQMVNDLAAKRNLFDSARGNASAAAAAAAAATAVATEADGANIPPELPDKDEYKIMLKLKDAVAKEQSLRQKLAAAEESWREELDSMDETERPQAERPLDLMNLHRDVQSATLDRLALPCTARASTTQRPL